MKKLTILLLLIGSYGLQAQNFEPDASIWLNPWLSCNASMNPKASYGDSHWIRYDLGLVRRLSKTWVWNINDPQQLDAGFDRVKVDYSLDGRNWTYHGEMSFPKADGEAVYGGFPGPDLVGVKARYVLLTVLSTHGNTNCAGISEMKFNLLPPRVDDDQSVVTSIDDEVDEEEFILYPNPTRDEVRLLTGYTGDSDLMVISLSGEIVYEDEVFTEADEPLVFETDELSRGVYLVVLMNEDFRQAKKLIVR